jgi:hypothetical protein
MDIDGGMSASSEPPIVLKFKNNLQNKQTKNKNRKPGMDH